MTWSFSSLHVLLSDQVTRFLAFLASFSMEMTARDGKGAGIVWFGATEGPWVLLVSLSRVLPEVKYASSENKNGSQTRQREPQRAYYCLDKDRKSVV